LISWALNGHTLIAHFVQRLEGMIMQLEIVQPGPAPMPERPAASTATPSGAIAVGRGRVPPAALLVLAIIFVQLGAALATMLFPTIGATGTAFISTFFSAAVVTLLVGLHVIPVGGLRLQATAHAARRHWRLILLFGFTIALLTLTYYLALETLPLGIVATITFLGPLGLAVATSRRPVHFLWIGVAALGIALLTPEVGANLDLLGLFYAAVAALAWAGFVPLSKRIGSVLPGQAGLAYALWAATAMLLPPAVVERSLFSANLDDIAGALAVSLLGLVLPTMLEFAALQRMSPRTYGILVTLEPAIGAVVGVLCLDQPAGPRMLVAVACVMLAAVGVTVSDRRDAQ
jgi:inner membrane transporter RhtA